MNRYPASIDLERLGRLAEQLADKAIPVLKEQGRAELHISPESMKAFAGNIPVMLDEVLERRGLSANSRIWTGAGHSGVINITLR